MRSILSRGHAGIRAKSIQETRKFEDGSIVIWSYFLVNNLGPEFFGYETKDTLFIQDDAPKRKAKITMN